MLRRVTRAIYWNARLAAKFLWAAPGATSAVVFFTLISQLSMLLAFFLPLKVLILLGSEGIPRYFPPMFEHFDRNALIVWLSVATIAFYALHLLAERIIALGVERGAQTVLERGRKMVLFENQDEVAARGYTLHAEMMAGTVFVLLSIAVLFWLYPSVGLLITGYVVVVALGLMVVQAGPDRFRMLVNENLTGWLGVAAGVGFMLAFAYLVIDFLYHDPPGLIPAIIALLLSRQGLNRLSRLVAGLFKQHSQQAKLDALFFHGAIFNPAEAFSSEWQYWDLLQPERRKQWIPGVISALRMRGTITLPEGEWWQLGVRNVACIYLGRRGMPPLLLKLCHSKAKDLIAHEAILLSEPPKGLPAPRWLGAVDLEGYACHAYELPEGIRAPGKGVVRKNVLDFVACMAEIRPPDRMCRRYRRSRALLPERVRSEWLHQLRVAANREERQRLEFLAKQIDYWKKQLLDLPLTFISSDLKPTNLAVTEKGSLILLDWGKWRLEPEGSDFLRGREKQKWLVRKADLGRGNAIALASLTYLLEGELNQGNLSAALAVALEVEAELIALASRAAASHA